jgi:hypothetical protein
MKDAAKNAAARFDKARALADRYAAACAKHESTAARAAGRGDVAKRDRAAALAIRAEQLHRKWQNEASRLSAHASRARVAARQAADALLRKAVSAAKEPKPPTAREQREQHKRARAAAQAAASRHKRLSAAGIDAPPGTAAAGREYAVVSTGHSLRASIGHLNNCFRRGADRTDSRVLAWAKVDALLHKVHSGEIPEPRFEPGVDRSSMPDMPAARIAAARENASLRAWVGNDSHALLEAVVFRQESYKRIADDSGEDERTVGTMFKRALDQAAYFFGVGEDNSFGREANRVLRRRERSPVP